MRRNLLALGSVAVLAVYTAGYERTREAAARFADEAEHRRRPPTPSPVPSPTLAPVPPTIAETKAPIANKPASPRPKPKAQPVKKPPVETTKAVEASPTSPTTAAVPDSQVVPPVAVAPPTDTATLPVAGSDSARAAKAAPKWKDGTYSGWGTSRHGDLEASVEIKDGRIVSAWISQCWTRYPCSRIDALPPQVVERQSANVDVISRVTQSSDAFYYGVLQALAKAKP